MLLSGAGVANAQTNYPLGATLELRDAQGGSIEDGVCVGAEIKVTANGWQAGADLRAQYLSDPVELGTFKADNDGAVAFSFNVPDVPPVPGTHTFRLSGVSADGQSRIVEAAIRVLDRCAQNGTAGGVTDAGGSGNPAAVVSNAGASASEGAVSNAGATANPGARSTVAKTGAFLGRWAFVGFTLLALGAALAVAVRSNRSPAPR